MNLQYDIAIIGGGPVGAALALALNDSNLRVCILEARPADSFSADARALALSYGSRLILERLGVWNSIRDFSAIRHIHISQKQSFGRTLLHATEMTVPELGYVLPYRTLQDSLSQILKECDIASIYSANVSSLTNQGSHSSISYLKDNVEHILTTRLAVVADGGRLLSQQFPPEIYDYGQSALITHITCSAPKADTAFERFTKQGPIALLPYQHGYELVWTASHDVAQQMLEWDETRFLHELHQHFGDRVGKFLTVSKRTCFPLGLRRAPHQSPMPHTVLLGNASQTLHPVAGQGFNMGLRDAWELSQEILDVSPEILGTEIMLASYRSHRRIDREAGIKFTDALVRLFSNDLPLLNAGRSAALTAIDCLPFAKQFIAKRMMFGANG